MEKGKEFADLFYTARGHVGRDERSGSESTKRGAKDGFTNTATTTTTNTTTMPKEWVYTRSGVNTPIDYTSIFGNETLRYVPPSPQFLPPFSLFMLFTPSQRTNTG